MTCHLSTNSSAKSMVSKTLSTYIGWGIFWSMKNYMTLDSQQAKELTQGDTPSM